MSAGPPGVCFLIVFFPLSKASSTLRVWATLINPATAPFLSCRRHLERGVLMEEERIWSYFIQIARGLSFLHAHGILHRCGRQRLSFIKRQWGCPLCRFTIGLPRQEWVRCTRGALPLRWRPRPQGHQAAERAVGQRRAGQNC